MSPYVRHATEDDLTIIQSIASLSWAQAYNELIPSSVQKEYIESAYAMEQLKNRLETTSFFVGEWEGKVVSFANLYCSAEEFDLSAIYVHPEFQSKGIGSALLNNLFQELQTGDELVVYLEKGNHQAEFFYRKHGFVYVESFNEFLFNHTFKTVKMSIII